MSSQPDNYNGSHMSKGAYLKSTGQSSPSSSKSSSNSSTIKKAGKELSKSYDAAIKTYQNLLPALKPKYDAVIASTEAEKQAALDANTQLAGKEQMDLKSEIAKRGLSVSTDDSNYNTQSNALQGNQDVRTRGISTAYDTSEANTRLAQNADEENIHSAISSLLVDKGKGKYATAQDITAANEWQATFDFTKSKDAADRAIELKKLALATASAGGGSGSKAYNNDLATIVGTAYAGGLGNGQGVREAIEAQLKAKYPKQAGQVVTDVQKFLPNGWEGQIYSTASSAGGGSGDDATKAYIDAYKEAGYSDSQIKAWLLTNKKKPGDFGY